MYNRLLCKELNKSYRLSSEKTVGPGRAKVWLPQFCENPKGPNGLVAVSH